MCRATIYKNKASAKQKRKETSPPKNNIDGKCWPFSYPHSSIVACIHVIILIIHTSFAIDTWLLTSSSSVRLHTEVMLHKTTRLRGNPEFNTALSNSAISFIPAFCTEYKEKTCPMALIWQYI